MNPEQLVYCVYICMHVCVCVHMHAYVCVQCVCIYLCVYVFESGQKKKGAWNSVNENV